MELKRKQELIAEDTSLPWLPYEVIFFLERVIRKSWSVFEWGSGCSTFWIRKRVRSVVSVETNPNWAEVVNTLLKRKKSKRPVIVCTEEEAPDTISVYNDQVFDLIIVDGRNRPACLKAALSKVKVGGYILLDNTNREKYHKAMKKVPKRFTRMDFVGWGRCDPRQPARQPSKAKRWTCTIWKREA